MKRVKRLGISARLSLMVMGLTAAAVIAMVAAIALRVNRFARQNAIEIATETASARGTAVKNTLENALDEAKSLSKVFEAAGVVANAGISRRQANSLLQYYIEHSPQFYGAYVAFEPNAYDGKDENFVDEWGHDSTGRFIPYWTRDEKGEGALNPLSDTTPKGWETTTWCRRSSDTKPSSIRVSSAQAKGVTIVSLVVPMFNLDKAFLGIAGIDITLDGIRKMVADDVLYRSGTLTLYSANGTVAGARDAAAVGKKASETEAGRAPAGQARIRGPVRAGEKEREGRRHAHDRGAVPDRRHAGALDGRGGHPDGGSPRAGDEASSCSSSWWAWWPWRSSSAPWC